MREFARWGTWLGVCVALAGCGDGVQQASWRLPDDSQLLVTTDPSPARAGAATLLAIIGHGDWSGEPFSGGRVFYRLASAGDSQGTWLPMRRDNEVAFETVVGDTVGDHAIFTAPIVLPAGEVGLHFRVEGGVFSSPIELTDWRLEVE